MKVELIDFTGAGSQDPARHAAEVLAFTKSTRLEMSPHLRDEISGWSDAELDESLEYMANTIPSSWEFVDYTFLISGVTRAFTHQFVRTRTGSYAQQTMRTIDVQGWDYSTGPSISSEEARGIYDEAMENIRQAHKQLAGLGVKSEDSRGVLPTNIHTNIVAKFNLRTLAETFRKRSSARVQGEYREVVQKMREAVETVHPWSSKFFNRTFDVAALELQETVEKMGLERDDFMRVVKLIDQMRNG